MQNALIVSEVRNKPGCCISVFHLSYVIPCTPVWEQILWMVYKAYVRTLTMLCIPLNSLFWLLHNWPALDCENLDRGGGDKPSSAHKFIMSVAVRGNSRDGGLWKRDKNSINDWYKTVILSEFLRILVLQYKPLQSFILPSGGELTGKLMNLKFQDPSPRLFPSPWAGY